MLPRSSRWATVLLLGVPVVLLLVASGMESRWLLPPGLIVFVAVVIAVSWLPSDLVARRRRLTRITWIAGFSVVCIVIVSATAISAFFYLPYEVLFSLGTGIGLAAGWSRLARDSREQHNSFRRP
jgi:hypothetical protein